MTGCCHWQRGYKTSWELPFILNELGTLEVNIACIACLLTYKTTWSFGLPVAVNVSYDMYIAVTLFHYLYVKFIIQCYLANIKM